MLHHRIMATLLYFVRYFLKGLDLGYGKIIEVPTFTCSQMREDRLDTHSCLRLNALHQFRNIFFCKSQPMHPCIYFDMYRIICNSLQFSFLYKSIQYSEVIHFGFESIHRQFFKSPYFGIENNNRNFYPLFSQEHTFFGYGYSQIIAFMIL